MPDSNLPDTLGSLLHDLDKRLQALERGDPGNIGLRGGHVTISDGTNPRVQIGRLDDGTYGVQMWDETGSVTSGDLLGTFSFAGPLSPRTGKLRLYAEASCVIMAVRASADTAPGGAAIKVDILKAGTTSIFASSADVATIAPGGHTSRVSPTGIASLLPGEYVVPQIVSVGTGPTGADLTVNVLVRLQ